MAASTEPASKAAPGRRARKGNTRARRDSRFGVSLVSPTFIVVMAMVILPVLWALVLSFQRIRLSGIGRLDVFGGEYTLRNYDLLLGSSDFLAAARTTLLYSVLGTAGAIGLGLIAALLVRSSFRGRGIVRGIMLLPYVAPVVAVTFIWQILLSPQLCSTSATSCTGSRLPRWPLSWCLRSRSHRFGTASSPVGSEGSAPSMRSHCSCPRSATRRSTGSASGS